MKRVVLSIAISGAVGLLVGRLIDITFGIVAALILGVVLPVFFIKVLSNPDDATDNQAKNAPDSQTEAARKKTLSKALGMAQRLRHDLLNKLNADPKATHLEEEIQRLVEREKKLTKELTALNQQK